jgi:hypothetical protein
MRCRSIRGKVSSFISSNKISIEVRSPSDTAIFAAGLAPTAVFRRRVFDGFWADKLILLGSYWIGATAITLPTTTDPIRCALRLRQFLLGSSWNADHDLIGVLFNWRSSIP